jgi:pantoate--beta-alanine ligase
VRTVRTRSELRAALAGFPGGARVGLVPTMGAFHEGHVSLFRAARRECDAVVVSLFVNPAQFGPAEDLDRYPRDEEGDARLAAAEGVDVLFAPAAAEMYAEAHQTWVEVEGLSRDLEGAARPGHFRGVATVCLKLFNLVRPAAVYFGEKDAQQAALVRRLVRDLDLDLDVEVRVLPTVRDADGLALSSRNGRLSPDERLRALALPRALARGAEAHAAGADPLDAARAVLNGVEADYLALADFEGRPYLVAAVRVGDTRLIDNVPLDRPEEKTR